MASYYPDAAEEARLDAQIHDAVIDAMPDDATLAPVEARLAADELVPDARAEDEAYARELTERLQSFADRAEVELATLRMLIAGEVKRRATGRRRLTTEAPLELYVMLSEAKLAEDTAKGRLAAAQAVFDEAEQRRAIAEAAVRVYGVDRREHA